MSGNRPNGISRAGLDAAFGADETRVSNLLIDAQFLEHQGRAEEAVPKFAEAAEIEERLARICREKGLIEKSFVHHFSAASCWARAGDFYDAIRLCDDLLGQPDVPDRLRRRVQEYSESLKRNRAEWNARTLAETVSSEA